MNQYLRSIALSTACGACCGLFAQTPELVMDIIPGPEGPNLGYPTVIGDQLMMRVTTPAAGTELWRTDGTAAGTMIVKDIRPGAASSWPENFVEHNGFLYFRADDGEHGVELWRSDGTDAGTQMVIDLAPGNLSSFPVHPTPSEGGLFFFYSGGLMWTDGTEAGTELVAAGVGVTSLWTITMDGVLYFGSEDPDHGTELWRSDGTASGTYMVKDIYWGSFSSLASSVTRPTAIENILYFTATDELHGRELWRTDGTEAGTWMVKDIEEGVASSSPYSAQPLGGRIVFSAEKVTTGRELWTSDGTPAGTAMLSELNAGPSDGVDYSLYVSNGRILFFGSDGGTNHGQELFAYDGSTLYLVKDICVGPDSAAVLGVVSGCGGLIFGVNDCVHGGEIWRSNGTESGTFMIGEVIPGPLGISTPLAVLGDVVLMRAWTPEYGYEPWVVNCGTVGVTSKTQAETLHLRTDLLSNTITLELPESNDNWTITLYDGSGRSLLQSHTRDRFFNISVAQRASGVYIVTARGSNSSLRGRVIVQ